MALGNRAERLANLLRDMEESGHPEQVALASAVKAGIDKAKPSESYHLALTTGIELAACARELVQNLKAIDYSGENT